MRVTVLGLGAIGGPMAAAFHQAGVLVRGLARGAHLAAIREGGLRVRAPWGDVMLALEVAEDPAAFAWDADDVVVLATKSQDTAGALEALARAAPREVAVVCAQNGLANERLAARHFDRVYGAMVYVPGVHLEPGVVATYAAEGRGLIDVGPTQGPVDAVARDVSAALQGGGFLSEAVVDVMGLKRAKLFYNLANVIQALVGAEALWDATAPVRDAAVAEAEAVYRAAGWDPEALRERFLARVAVIPASGTVDGEGRGGGSSWQSLRRGAGSIETAWLNGEVVRMGAQFGIPTPVNAKLVALGEAACRSGTPPGSMTPAELAREVLDVG